MESPRRRTPLSDQTNTTTTTPSSAAAATTSVTTTTTQSKPLKPYTATTRTRRTTSCSPKSNSSIGSNLPETVLESDKTHVSETRKDKQKASPEDLLFIDRFHLRLPLGPITLRKAVNIDFLDETQFARTRKDKGKAVLRGPPIGSSYLFAASIPQAPVSSASGGRRSVAPGTSEETLVAKTRKGTNVCENVGFQTSCNPRRGIEKVINAHRRSTAALSCSHGKRSRETWFKVNTGASDSKSGSFSDPLPLHKMRRRRHAKPVPSMPPDEAEKLRAQYAEIDAFELPVESESE
ncbi:hypothetical protein Droror1_Dr00018245 [Drosera rotundifolia]